MDSWSAPGSTTRSPPSARCSSNPTQRAALLRLLDDLLPPDPSLPGWYPLLDTEVGNLYLTVENDIVGVAAALHSGVLGSGVGQVQGTVRVPLISVAGDFEAIAGHRRRAPARSASTSDSRMPRSRCRASARR